MPTELFNKYEYHNELCEHDLSGLEMRILIRLSNCYGRDGLICPSNAKIAIWLGKLTQEDYDKPDKTDDEKKKLNSAKASVKKAMAKLNGKFIKTELKGNSRKILLLKPGNPDIWYKGSPNGYPLKSGGPQMDTRGPQTDTPGSPNGYPPIIKGKIIENINTVLPKNIKYQVSQIYFNVPFDIKSDPKKSVAAKKVIRAGIGNIGFFKTEDLVKKISAGSHIDYTAALELKLNEVAQ